MDFIHAYKSYTFLTFLFYHIIKKKETSARFLFIKLFHAKTILLRIVDYT